MKHLFKGSKLVVFVMMLSVMTGCAISGGKVPRAKLVAPAENQTKPTLSYSINSSGPHLTKKEFLEELSKSQYFGEITEESSEADIELKVSLMTTGNLGDLVRASGFTFGIIPLVGTDNYTVVAQVNNKKGLKKFYTLENSVTFGLWLPLIVFTPFTYYTDENVRRNMYRNIIQQMYEDGFMGEI